MRSEQAGAANGGWVNPTGIGVFVTKSGSMTKERFPAFCRHFITNLPDGQGKGGEPVILVFDGHASRWSLDGLKLLLENNIYCLCLPGHTSIWAQPNDGGPNASFKSTLGDSISTWRTSHRQLPGSEAVQKMTRADFNEIFCKSWLTWKRKMRLEKSAGSNCILTAWTGSGLHPYNRESVFWHAAIDKFGKCAALSMDTGKNYSTQAASICTSRSKTAALKAAFQAAQHRPATAAWAAAGFTC